MLQDFSVTLMLQDFSVTLMLQDFSVTLIKVLSHRQEGYCQDGTAPTIFHTIYFIPWYPLNTGLWVSKPKDIKSDK